MSQFECLVNDLNGNSNKNTAEKPQSKSMLPKGEYSINSHEHSNENPHMNSNENTGLNKFININSTIFNKLTDHKNIRVVLVVVISYLVTNSSQFIDLLGNSFPYLIEEGTTNLIGKLIIAILIGFSVVMFTSFFEVP